MLEKLAAWKHQWAQTEKPQGSWFSLAKPGEGQPRKTKLDSDCPAPAKNHGKTTLCPHFLQQRLSVGVGFPLAQLSQGNPLVSPPPLSYWGRDRAGEGLGSW